MAAAPATVPLHSASLYSKIALEPWALRVTVVDGPDRRLEGVEARSALVIERPKVTVGRAPNVDVRLADPTVSFFHVELQGDRQSVLIMDCGSSNGVWVGDLQIGNARIPSGRQIRIGQTTLRVDTVHPFTPPRSKHTEFGKLIGRSKAMRQCFAELEEQAASDDDILLEGESGTGKDLAARAIHSHSRRKDGPFVAVNCGALPYSDVSQVHSALFGHRKGSFTGATSSRKGAFVEAHGGVLFLDEIGDLPLQIQTLLLHALERREVMPLGSDKAMPVNVRVIFATWHNLQKMVNESRFRTDLYHRMGAFPITMPPLAERPEDTGLLVDVFVKRFSSEFGSHYSMDPSTRAMLVDRDYRGNVRELEKLVRRLVQRRADAATAREFLARYRVLGRSTVPAESAETPLKCWREAKLEYERAYLERLLGQAASQAQAARSAGLTRTQLGRMIARSRISPYSPDS